MTSDEAKIIASIIERADTGCSACQGDLADRLKLAFPDFDWWPLVKEAEAHRERLLDAVGRDPDELPELIR